MIIVEKFYTGIGSRETPKTPSLLFFLIGKTLAKWGFTLRSGHAVGADKAFEDGCDSSRGKKEIWLPWKGFNGSDSNFIVSDKKAFDLAENFHPNWNKLSIGAKKLHARNTHQILGKDLLTQSEFIICWTKDGKGSGGTGQALRIGKAYNIPILDLGIYNEKDIDTMQIAIRDFINKFIEIK